MNIETIVLKIAADHGLKRRGKVFAGPCPECGGSGRSDKFNIRLDGGFKCYACGFRGDIITWLRKREGMSCPDAHDHAGKECQKATTCPAGDKCRHGEMSGSATPKHRTPVRRNANPYQPPRNERTMPVIVPEFPKMKWNNWAEDLVAKAHAKLLANTEQLTYLASRGIPTEAVNRFNIGFLDHQQQVAKNAIELPIESDGKEKLWVPDGLLIPIHQENNVHRIRVRRSSEARGKFRADLKYVWIKGSGNMPLVIMPESKPRGAVVVEAELDAFAIAHAHPEVVVISIGTVSGGVDAALFNVLTDLPVILVALDAEGSAKKSIQLWKNTFAHARFWGTPQTKDAGDYFKAGGDLYQWIEDGLPLKIHSTTSHSAPAPKQDGAFSPARCTHGGKGKEVSSSTVVELTLSNGKIIYVTNDQETWQELMDQGKPVFTQHELDRLKVAFATMTPEQRIKAAMAAIEVKEVFGGYIDVGRTVNKMEVNNATRSI